MDGTFSLWWCVPRKNLKPLVLRDFLWFFWHDLKKKVWIITIICWLFSHNCVQTPYKRDFNNWTIFSKSWLLWSHWVYYARHPDDLWMITSNEVCFQTRVDLNSVALGVKWMCRKLLVIAAGLSGCSLISGASFRCPADPWITADNSLINQL